MPAGTNKNVAVIAVIAVLIPILVAVWFALPFFLPMYSWLSVDLRAISASSGIPEATLGTKFQMKVRYHPRGEGDPVPWQIISMTPTWLSLYPDQDEEELLVRCTFVSGNDGKPPGTAFINNTFKDRYYDVTGIRLPPGTFGFNAKRPVVVYDQFSFNRMSITNADMSQRTVQAWESDDEWNERNDGWVPPELSRE